MTIKIHTNALQSIRSQTGINHDMIEYGLCWELDGTKQMGLMKNQITFDFKWNDNLNGLINLISLSTEPKI